MSKKFTLLPGQKGNFLAAKLVAWRFSQEMKILVGVEASVKDKLVVDGYIAEAILCLLASEDIISRAESWMPESKENTEVFMKELAKKEEKGYRYFSFSFCHSLSLGQ